MDYWARLKLTVHDDTAAFLEAADRTGGGRWLFSTKGNVPLWEAGFHDGDWLLFGSETHGLDQALRASHPGRVVRIPQGGDERCLNLSSAAAIGLYEALRRIKP